MKPGNKKKVWIDLENSPHVPFFKPIMDELERRDYDMVVTARDCFQVCGLADLSNIKYSRIGKHYGKHKLLKAFGLLVRAMQLMPTVLRERPDIAVSHGSRTQQVVSTLLRIPNVMIFDYEHATALPMLVPDYVVVPDVIADDAVKFQKARIYKYPGIKEDVYVPDFRPDPAIRGVLGLMEDDIVATIRPPASEAHYRSEMSDRLFDVTIETLAATKDVKMVMLPRTEDQADSIREHWPDLCESGRIIFPPHVVDGLNLIWYSDFVISGGGTMNREAAAMGVPVYSIFRGKTGAVDRFLSSEGRLILLENEEHVRTRLAPVQRDKTGHINAGESAALEKILAVIEEAAHNNEG